MRWIVPVLLISALAVTGCSGDVPSRRPTPERSAEGTPQATPPLGLDAPGESSQGKVGDAAALGGWTILVREAEFEGADEGSADGSDDGTPAAGSVALRLEIDVSHNRDTARRVVSEDWSLVDTGGNLYKPRNAGAPDERGQRTIPPGETEDVKLYFDVPETGAYVLRFEPAAEGGAALNIAVP